MLFNLLNFSACFLDGMGPTFPLLDNSLSSLSRLDISDDKKAISAAAIAASVASGGLIRSPPGGVTGVVGGNNGTPNEPAKDPRTNKYSCQRCGRSYLHQATLVRHQRYECGITASYPCRLCGRKFKRRDVLKGHMEKCMNKSTAAVAASLNTSMPASVTTSPLITTSSSSPLRGSSSPLTPSSVAAAAGVASIVPSSLSPFPSLMH